MLDSYFSIDIKGKILAKVKKKFFSANLLPNQTYHEAGKSVIGILLKSKEIDTNIFQKFFKDEKYNEILKANVFAYRPSKDTITFHSKSIEAYIQENSSIFTKSNRYLLFF